jgi:hypothetical protein
VAAVYADDGTAVFHSHSFKLAQEGSFAYAARAIDVQDEEGWLVGG